MTGKFRASLPKWHGRVFGLRDVLVFGFLLVGVVVVVLLSLMFGAAPVSLQTVWRVFLDTAPGGVEQVIVLEMRLPRTIIAAITGSALAMAGVILQALIRNPLADPGLLGVNAGASCAVAAAAAVGVADPGRQVWWSLIGAFLVSALVVWLGSLSPVQLLLVGVAITAILTGITTALTLIVPRAFDLMRGWVVGALDSRGTEVIGVTGVAVALGMVLAWISARGLAALQLGEDSAVSLGVRVRRTRFLVVTSVALLAGGATAAAGPVAFLGLLMAHLARALVGPDPRRMMPVAIVGGPILLLLADIIGRFIVQPAEMPAGLMVAFLGGPLLVMLVLRKGVR
ncbi:iron chelate uptake ABC transporter family permease subunit [Corynebacterium sp. TAE3-ERU12]|uniref:FecCD family ABC transporter permease n=1 Tax=Corynebacterium sp. TAE3-ERU12 TaxID=2849491 RepID=UPI001C4885C4|nr:iron chelate uptake ABC transporter family permease subunit [Corynebacterium sp. TAE3-ERU12]MBV7294656.1 iron chelate uptake ABC transporter family permease subunit [Corynebacterium sp. TAE3-ERU12]